MNELSNAQRGGRVVLLVYLVLIVATSVGVKVAFAVLGGTDRLPLQLAQVALTVALCVWLYGGSRMAKWVTVVLFTLGGAISVPQVLSDEPLVVVSLGGLAALYLSFAAVLIASPRVNAFLDRSRHTSILGG